MDQDQYSQYSTVEYSLVLQFDLVHLVCYKIAGEVVPSHMVLVYIKYLVYKYITSCVEPAYFVSPLGTLYQAIVLLLRHTGTFQYLGPEVYFFPCF